MGKYVTMKWLAKELGLSINAVSLALNNKVGVSQDTRRRVLKLASDVGYINQFERYNKAFTSTNICVIMMKQYYSMSFYPHILYGVEKTAKANGYNIMMNYVEGAADIPNMLSERRACGIIVLGQIDDDYLVRISKLGIPIVLVDYASQSVPLDCILTDNRFGTLRSVRFLLGCGYKKIGYFGDFSYSNSNRERFYGYMEALMQNFSHAEALEQISRYSVLDRIEPYIVGRDTDAIMNILKKLPELPEAFQCSNDTAAVVLSNALRNLGYKIPDQIALVGFDDKDIATIMQPKLTTLHVSTGEMGQRAVEKLLWRLSNRNSPREKILMPVQLIVRESTNQGGGPNKEREKNNCQDFSDDIFR